MTVRTAAIAAAVALCVVPDTAAAEGSRTATDVAAILAAPDGLQPFGSFGHGAAVSGCSPAKVVLLTRLGRSPGPCAPAAMCLAEPAHAQGAASQCTAPAAQWED